MVASAVLEELSRYPQAYEFLQAYRILERAVADQTGVSGVVMRPRMTLDTPDADLAAVSVDPVTGLAVLDVQFMGLYGASSPLPAYYHDQLVRQGSADRSFAQILLDVFHQRALQLLADIKKAVRHGLEDVGRNDNFTLGWRALAGDLGGRQAFRLECASLYRLPYRSAEGLRVILSQFCARVFAPWGVVPTVMIKEFVATRQPLSRDDRLALGIGKRLGLDTLLGEKIIDRHGTVVVQLETLSTDAYQHLTTDADTWNEMVRIVTDYSGAGFEYLLDVAIRDAEPLSVPADQSMGRVGVSAWLGSHGTQASKRASVRMVPAI